MMEFLMSLIIKLIENNIINGYTVKEMYETISKENDFDKYFFEHVEYKTIVKDGIEYVPEIYKK